MRLSVVAAGLLLLGGNALACGHCVEDKIASVYDHSVVTSALAAKHRVAYFAIDGLLDNTDRQRRFIENMVRLSRGIDPGSARISLESAALAVAFDPARVSLDEMQTSLQHNFAIRHLTLELLRVTGTSAQLEITPGT